MKTLLDASGVDQAVQKMADSILQSGLDPKTLILVGIRTRGVFLAQSLIQILKEKSKVEIPLGILDITLYRDDLSRLSEHPVIKETAIPVSINDRTVLLVDDVLYTGRTIRAALDAIFDFGRPAKVQLAVLVDREGRELPIEPQFVGIKYAAKKGENVKVRFKQSDDAQGVEVLNAN